MHNPSKFPFKDPAVWLSTWFGTGFAGKAPGTWGTLAGIPFALFFIAVGGWPLLLIATLALTYFGTKQVERYEELSGSHDSSEIVVDEVVGIWIAMLGASVTLISVVLAFALFRLFDIWKPGPIGWADRQPGAKGVMLDDIIAGIFTALILIGLRYVGIDG